jgi:hypothetical protein
MKTHHQSKENRIEKHHRQATQMNHFHSFIFNDTKELGFSEQIRADPFKLMLM